MKQLKGQCISMETVQHLIISLPVKSQVYNNLRDVYLQWQKECAKRNLESIYCWDNANRPIC